MRDSRDAVTFNLSIDASSCRREYRGRQGLTVIEVFEQAGISFRRDYQSVVSPLAAPERMAFRTASIVARPPGAVAPHSNRVAAGVQ